MDRARKTLGILACCIVLTAMLAGCGKEPRQPRAVLDTPEHHYLVGVKKLDDGDLAAATLAFNAALELNPEYGPAMAGKGVVLAKRAAGDKALDMIDDAYDNVEDDAEELQVVKAEIWALSALAAQSQRDPETLEDLVDDAEDAYDDGLDLVEDLAMPDAELHYRMAEAYLQGLRFESAEELFAAAADLGGEWGERAEKRWRFAQRARRAAPRTTAGKRIALNEALTRADMAALLVEELDVERFYTATARPAESSFTPPEKKTPGQKLEEQKGVRAGDALNHPLQNDIVAVVEMGVRGMGLYPDLTFRPDEPVTRAEAAMIFEDVIVRAVNDPSLATKFIGSESPYPDVRTDHGFFNAVMVTTSRGLFTPNARTGLFEPMEPISGADAVLAVNRLKRELRLFSQ